MAVHEHLSLLKLQSVIKDRLAEAIPLPVWVTAEISELKVNYSGHCYLELVEKGGANQVPCARASAVIWRSTFGAVDSFFKSATGGPITEGMKVLMKVTVNYHELYGLSLVVSDIDPAYTIGDMERQRQETIQRLREEGVYDMNRSLDLPEVIQRIAVVSSKNAAGYQDFIKELETGGFYFGIKLFDSFMQGHGTEDSVVAALDAIAEESDDFDVVVVIRGGGSQSDLAAFDSYRLCTHLAQFPLPVITGIGHDKDESVADLVASVSLKTPTAVAAWLVDGLAQFNSWLDGLQSQITEAAGDVLEDAKTRLRTAGFKLSVTVSAFTRSLEIRLEKLAGEVAYSFGTVLIRQGSLIESLSSTLKDKVSTYLTRHRHELELAIQIVDGRRTERILSLGFAIVRKNNIAVNDAANLSDGDIIELTFAKGTANAEVKQ